MQINFKKTWVLALIITMLLGAGSHLAIMYGKALITGEYEIINIFRLLEYQNLFPGIEKGPVNFGYSYLFAVVIYTIVFKVIKRLQKP